MSSGQRLIKYLAIAFAVFLAISIISGIVSVVFAIFNVIPGTSFKTGKWHRETTDYTQSFENVESIDVDNAVGSFRILTGETFKVEAENVSKDFKAELKSNGTLKISDNDGASHFPFFNIGSPNSKVILYLPEGFVADKADIETGAGSLTIEGLQADKLEVSAGAGSFSGRDITAEKADIEGGVGSVNLSDVYFTDAVLESGVGSLNIDGTLHGRSEISCGVGEVELNLTGSTSEYGFIIDSGIGRIRLNGQKISGEYKSNTEASDVIEIDGGVGNVDINMEEE
jgi:DUF4097 and DUF4098 domain-containing protein YvlB